MSAPDNTPEWFAGIAAAVGIGYAWLRKIFVTNRELYQLLDAQEERREKIRYAQHTENLGNFSIQDKRLEKVEQGLARIEGILSGRYPRIDR